MSTELAEAEVVKPEIYISHDIESDGPVPGLNSMLQMGSAAFTLEHGLLATFKRNLKMLPGATQDPQTMGEFWAQYPELYMKTRVEMVDPKQAMHEFDLWLAKFESQYKIVNVAGPAAFDFPWLTYYMSYAKGHKRHHLGYACFDIRSYAAAVLKQPYRMTGKRSYPEHWFEEGLPHTHDALDDATEQGAIVFNMMREHLGMPKRAFLPEDRRKALVAAFSSDRCIP